MTNLQIILIIATIVALLVLPIWFLWEIKNAIPEPESKSAKKKTVRACADCLSQDLVPYGYNPVGYHGLKCNDCGCKRTGFFEV